MAVVEGQEQYPQWTGVGHCPWLCDSRRTEAFARLASLGHQNVVLYLLELQKDVVPSVKVAVVDHPWQWLLAVVKA